MKRIVIVLITIFTLSASNSNAQNAKIAYMDYLAVIDSLPSKLKADNEIKSFYDIGQKTILQMTEQLELAIIDFQGARDTSPDIIVEIRMKQLNEQQELIRYKSESLEQDLNILNDRLYKPIEINLDKAIAIVAERHKITYILEVNSLLYFDPATAMNVTDEIKAEMMKFESTGTGQ